MKRILVLFIAIFALFGTHASAQTLADCSRTTLQNAINDTVTYPDGSTITLPNCSLGGTGDGTVPVYIQNRALTIHGQGPGATVLRSTSPDNPLIFDIITKSNGGGAAAPGMLRIADMTLDTGAGSYGGGSNGEGLMVNVTGNTRNFVMANIDYYHRRGAKGLLIGNDVRGVLQFHEFHNYGFAAPIIVHHDNWESLGYLYGDYSWASPSTLGSAAAVYIESSDFIIHDCSGYCAITDSDKGARIVWRGNRIDHQQLVMHGPDTPGRTARGTRQWEYYFNNFINYAGLGFTPIGLRGGTGFGFNNIEPGGVDRVGQADFQPADNPPYISHAPYSWADCRVRAVSQITCTGNTATIEGPYLSFSAQHYITIQGNSNSNFNGTWPVLTPASDFAWHQGGYPASPITATVNSCAGGTGTGGRARTPYNGMVATADGASDYPCMDGFGRGSGTLITGDGPLGGQGGYGTQLTIVSPNNQAFEPAYFWGNKTDGGTLIPIVQANDAALHNRDYFDQTYGSCVSGGACTSGMGRGATLPATCTPNVGGITGAGVGFALTSGVTDWNKETVAMHNLHDPTSLSHTLGADEVLYKCTSLNNWTPLYTPLEFPHPLLFGQGVGGGVTNQAPFVAITSPASNGLYDTGTSPLTTLSGTMSDIDGTVVSVTWTCSPSCGSGLATLGSGIWSVSSISIPSNTIAAISVFASDDDSASSSTVSLLANHVTTAVGDTDLFTRGNFPTLGQNWTHIGSGANYAISSNQALGSTTSFDAEKWDVSPSSADQCTQFTVKDVSPLVRSAAALVRINGTTNATLAYYGLLVNGTTNNSIIENVAGAGLNFLQTLSGVSFTTNDIAKICVEGNIIRAYKNGTQVGSDQVDTTLTDGETGIWLYGTALIDSFIGGNLNVVSNPNPVVTILSPTSAATYEVPSFPTITNISGEAGAGIGQTFPIRTLNSRYLTEDGIKAVILTGSHTWYNLVDYGTTTWPSTEEFDFYTWIDGLASMGQNFMRLWTWSNSRSYNYYGQGEQDYVWPLPWARSGSGTAADGGTDFDLSTFEPEYFNRLRDRALYAQSKGMYVSIMLFEGWESQYLEATWRANGNPFVGGNNINSVNGDTNNDEYPVEMYTLSIPAITTLQEAYVAHVLDTIADMPNVIVEICNECQSVAANWAWQEHFVSYVQSYEASNSQYQHLVWRSPGGNDVAGGGGVIDDTSPVETSGADIISPAYTWATYSPAGTTPVTSAVAPLIYDTDHIWGIGGTPIEMWRSLVRGGQPIYMDDPLDRLNGLVVGHPSAALRESLGDIQTFTDSLDLAGMTPSTTISSTTYALVNAGREYLVVQPSNTSFTVNLSAGSGDTYTVTWLRTDTGATQSGGTIAGGSSSQSFSNPFSGSPSGIVLKLDDGGTDGSDSIISTCTWASNQGGSGSCIGTTFWRIPELSVTTNATVVTVTVTNQGALTGTDTLTINGISVPGTPIDSFNRPDAASPGANWTILGTNTPGIVNNMLATVQDAPHYLTWNAHTLPSQNHCSESTIGVIGGTNSIGVIVRASSDTGAGIDMYHTIVNGPAFGQLAKVVNGTTTFLLPGNGALINWAPGDIQTLCAVGTNPTVLSWYRTPLGEVQGALPIGTYTDSSSPLAGDGIGVYQWGITARTDAWAGYEAAPVGDVTPPVVTITAPTTNPAIDNGIATISIGGTCTDAGSGVASVAWMTNNGQSGTASGTTDWTITGISTPVGAPTVIQVTCTDVAGNPSTPDDLSVTRIAGARKVQRRNTR